MKGTEVLMCEVRLKECSVWLCEAAVSQPLPRDCKPPKRNLQASRGGITEKKMSREELSAYQGKKFVGLEAIRQQNYLPRETVESMTPLRGT